MALDSTVRLYPGAQLASIVAMIRRIIYWRDEVIALGAVDIPGRLCASLDYLVSTQSTCAVLVSNQSEGRFWLLVVARSSTIMSGEST